MLKYLKGQDEDRLFVVSRDIDIPNEIRKSGFATCCYMLCSCGPQGHSIVKQARETKKGVKKKKTTSLIVV